MARSLVGLSLVLGGLLHGAPAALFQGSFDPSARQWQVVRGSATADPTVTREHRNSLRMEAIEADACVRSAAIALTVGKRYEVSGWVRTEQLQVRDLDRTPIAIGAALSMASLPFDVHSESVGATHDWTRLTLRFTATRPQDHILLTAGSGGACRGTAWFDGVSVDEASSKGEWPVRAAVTTFGPAYRYPTGGWIYLHIEGAPYERGYQHGHLLAKEIEQYVDRCASQLSRNGRNHQAQDQQARYTGWESGRTTANALFLRGFDREILEEMKGIAEGAAAAGAKWNGRPVDLIDIVAANTTTEISLLRAALPMTPTGLEGLTMRMPEYAPKPDVPVTARCSAFAATGKATRDGKMVIGHITMWPLTLAEQTNIMLDVKPTTGHRVLMQSYPGGIQSGTDYYQNDAGVVLTETTIRQSPFNVGGTPVAYRARKAIQYGDTVDKVVEYLGTKNNGLYTNEWLIGDAKTDEIAMYELGTYKTKLYRSSKNEWFGGTEGFYWGCNNAKDLNVRLEYVPDPKGEPAHLPFVPEARDIKWRELYGQHKGTIDEQFAFLAFRTAPLVSASAFDAKLATADMAARLSMWAVFGKPNQREWVPSDFWRKSYPNNDGIYSSGYRLISAEASETLRASIRENEKDRLAKKVSPAATPANVSKPFEKNRLWKGWILPASDSDLWLSAGSAAYYHDLTDADLEKALERHRARVRTIALKKDTPLNRLTTGMDSSDWYQLARHKGALLLDALRRQMGDDRFLRLMRDFFSANSTKTVTTRSFRDAAGKNLATLFTSWLDKSGLPGDQGQALYTPADLGARLQSALLVYGTVMDAGANRYAAEQLQNNFMNWYESEIPIRKDFEVTVEDLRTHDLIFVGRTESNSALAAWSDKLGPRFDQATFRVGGQDYASEKQSLLFATANPLDRKYMALIIAGNSALETVRLASQPHGQYQFSVYEAGKEIKSGFENRE